jgi:hypothetical protein
MFIKSCRRAVVTLALVEFVFGQRIAHAASTDEYANIRNVAVGSVIGDAYRLFNKGFTVFGNSAEEVPIGDWGVDAWVADQITKALSPRFVVKAVAPDAAAVDKCSNDWDDCSALPHRDDVDAYVIAVKRTINDVSGSPDLRGLGQMHSGGPFGLHYEEMHAAYMIVVIDAKSGRLIDYGSAWLSAFTPFGADEPVAAGLPASAWPGTASQMTDDQKNFAKDTMMKLIAASLPRALENAKLTAPASVSPAQ